MTAAEKLFLHACRVLALHRGGSADPEWRHAMTVLGEVLPFVPRPGPGPLIGGWSLRAIASNALARGPAGLAETRHMMGLLLADLAIGEMRQSHEAWRDGPSAQNPPPDSP